MVSLVASFLAASSLVAGTLASDAAAPTAIDAKNNVTYHGLAENNVEKFLNIPYGQDTGGPRRFAPPEPYAFAPGVTDYNASAAGPVCPQTVEGFTSYFTNATDQSEDCLRLKVARPAGTNEGAALPVLVWIYGGGLYNGNINERTNEPDALVLESVQNGLPVIFVAMNYRLNIFGFALSEALRTNKSLNVGLRDQRLALEWIQDNIHYFGGDPNRVTIFGQSSGALSVTLQILAYGGARGPPPFHGAIMMSTALEPTSTSNYSVDAYNGVANLTNCTSPGADPQSAATLACMRALPFEALLNATITQHDTTLSYTDGDIYLPAVDGDFLPLASSALTLRGLFPRMPVAIGWTQDDATLFTPATIATAADVEAFVHSYWPGLSNATVAALLTLYPAADFAAEAAARGLAAQFYRAAQIFRDILLTCPSFLFGGAMARKYSSSSSPDCERERPPVYLYTQNQTIQAAYLAANGLPGLGVVHTSDLAYVFANFTPYTSAAPEIAPSAADYTLLRQQSRSWSTFANTGAMDNVAGRDTLRGWEPSYYYPAAGGGDAGADGGTEGARVYVVGGPAPGMSTLEGDGAKEAVARQRLRERCGFLNREDVIEELQY